LASLVIAREEAILELVAVLHDVGGVGVGIDVFLMDLAGRQQVAHHARQERDVAAWPQRSVVVGYRGRPREARIDHDQLGTVIGLCFRDPLEPARMGFGGIAAHDQDDIGVLDVIP